MAAVRLGARAHRTPTCSLQTLARKLFLSIARVELTEPERKELAGIARQGTVLAAATRIARRTSQEPLWSQLLETIEGNDVLPEAECADLTHQTKLHAFRWASIRDSMAELLAALHEVGIRPVLLKGVALAGEVYDRPHTRPMRDVDVLVRPNEAREAWDAARASGFVAEPNARVELWIEHHHHLPPLFHKDAEVCLEIHHRPVNLPAWFRDFPVGDPRWSARRASRVFPGRAELLDPTCELLLLAAHVTHGDSIGRRAQNLIDIARSVQVHGRRIDWSWLLSCAASPDVARALHVPLGYLEREGLPSAPSSVLCALRSASRLGTLELALLWGLVDRYRLGAPGPWPFVSGRISNILWRRLLRGDSIAFKLPAFARDALLGR